jgi:hypothetical protein
MMMAPDTSHEEREVGGWFKGQIPDDWFADAPRIAMDRDEIMVVGDIAPPPLDDSMTAEARTEALRSRASAFRTRTRQQRVAIATDAETRFERKVSWGVRCGGAETIFTNLAAPAMTRLRMDERNVLDTLIDAGVARSRSEALAWCVRLVATHEATWLDELRSALQRVEQIRLRGPD